jgi:hypothetical protein
MRMALSLDKDKTAPSVEIVISWNVTGPLCKPALRAFKDIPTDSARFSVFIHTDRTFLGVARLCPRSSPAI